MTAPYTEGHFERAIEAHLLDHRWRAGDPRSYDRRLGLDCDELMAFVGDTQPTQWEALVADRYGGDRAKAREGFLKAVAKLIDSQGVLRCVRSGVGVMGIDFKLAYFRPEHGLTAELNELYEANRLAVVRQLAYSRAHSGALDMALLLNGVPIATVELKNKLTSQKVGDARRQYREKREPGELIFAKRAVVHFAVDTDEVYVTTKLAGEATSFLPFNRGHDGGAGNPPAQAGRYSTSYLWEELWQRDNWLELIHRFVHVRKDDRAQSVIFPRYHQWDAVRRLIAHARSHGPGSQYLVEHSAGSGKSNTIALLAHRLALLHDDDDLRVFDKVVIVTDRVALDRQLGDTIYQFEHVSGLVAQARSGSAQLANALESKTARIVISTLQKFPFLLDRLEAAQEGRFAIVIDEAHSSQGGDAAKALRDALGVAPDDADDDADDEADEVQDLIAASVQARGRQPNLSYFAFTATPTGRTLEHFGSPTDGGARRGPFHLYSMKQAIAEGFILDVLKHYTPYDVLWKVACRTDDEREVERDQAAKAIVKLVSSHPTTLREKASIVVDHCHNVVAHRINGKAKAMYVCASRELAVRTYLAIERAAEDLGYDDCRALVAFSESVTVDGETYTEGKLNGFGETQVAERFGWVPTGDPQRDEGKVPYRLLVVADKYQTGFDQPLLHTMYVDKKLSGVRAVQTLSRLNRVHDGKDETFVLDFVNDGEAIRSSFGDYYEATIADETDPAELYVAHGNLTAFGVLGEDDERAFATTFLGAPPDDDAAHAKLLNHLQPALERFEALDEDERAAFRAALSKFVDIYAFLAQVVSFADARLESTYLYGRHLLRILPGGRAGAVDLGGDVVLTHLRIAARPETNLSPAHGGDVIGPETGEASDVAMPLVERLRHIVDDLNARFGSRLGGRDRVLIEQVLEDMSGDEALLQKARVNSEDNFMLEFARLFQDEILNTESTNRTFFERFFSDDEFRDALIDAAGSEFHRRHRT